MQQNTRQDPNFVYIRVRTRQISMAIVSFEIIEFVLGVRFEANGLDGAETPVSQVRSVSTRQRHYQPSNAAVNGGFP
jgi:hypothetical protein